jgi:hypothetical protein
MSKPCLWGVFGLLFLIFFAQAAWASGDQWETQIALYGWLAGQKGAVATLPGLPSTELSILVL